MKAHMQPRETPVNQLDLALHISKLVNHVTRHGIDLELRWDFGYMVRLCEDLPDKPYPTAMFNPLHHDIGPDNGLWIKGTDRNGEVVHVQALRHDDLNGTNLAREFEGLTAFYFDPSVSAPEGEYCRSFAPAARRITGSVVYHGELWLKPGLNGARGQELSRPLGRLAMALALARWEPDYYYAITYDGVINRGLHQRFGFWHAQHGGVYWVRPYRDAPLDVHLMWLERSDLIDHVSDWSWQEGDRDVIREVGQAGENWAAVTELRAEQ